MATQILLNYYNPTKLIDLVYKNPKTKIKTTLTIPRPATDDAHLKKIGKKLNHPLHKCTLDKIQDEKKLKLELLSLFNINQ